ncbi:MULTISPECIES: hypothetical protein [Fusobacterium]|jgi:hypothetical protein|uniref:hypothetical protein n=1 Tax=Fusobacterium TaxID=848 RepID=UPI0015A565A0|nr:MULTISPECIES: hypothetical protein [Fusobacterium]MCF2612250.1 hypothetical protein [Fusobacterium perfoetens]MDY2980974.1 hypothetical protein [Fusobacterium sp.]
MKGQRINPEKINPMEINAMSSMMGMMGILQKIGKGKRKYSIKLEKNHKKFLARFMVDIKKEFEKTYANVPQMKGVLSFLDYIKTSCENKDLKELNVSYEEFDFLKRMLMDNLRGMEAMQLKWYQLIKKATLKMMKTQYRDILGQLK